MTTAIALEWGIRGAIPAAIVAGVLLLFRARDPRLEQQLWRSALAFACVMPLLTLLVAVVRLATTQAPLVTEANLTGMIATAGADSAPTLAATTATENVALRITMLVWLTVSTVLLTRLVIGGLGAWRLLRTSVAADRSLSSDHRVRISHALSTPATIGSTVLLPVAMQEWSAERRTAVITHELTHVQHRDFWWQLLARTYAAICWWNPVAWLFMARLRWLAERLSDAAALRVMPDRQAYAALLVDVAGRTRRTVPTFHVAMARPAMLRQRIEAVLQQADSLRLAGVRRLLAVSLPLCGASAAALTPMPRTELAITSLGQRTASMLTATDSVTIRLYSSPEETSRDPEGWGRLLSAPRSTDRVRWFMWKADGTEMSSGETPTVITLPVSVPFAVTFCPADRGTPLVVDYKFTNRSGGSHSSAACVRIFRERNMTGSRGVPHPRKG